MTIRLWIRGHYLLYLYNPSFLARFARVEDTMMVPANDYIFSQKLLRFSVAVSDFFVPNKTLYKDYIEFIKVKYYGKKSTLPSVYSESLFLI